MSEPDEAGDDTEAPQRGEPLFRVMADAMAQRTGEPTANGTGALRIEMTPTQMIRLQQALSGPAIHALMLVIEHGYRGGRRVEIHGWGGPWLREHGMRKYQAEKAAAELRDKGYVRVEREHPGSILGRQVGIVPSGHFYDVEDEVGVERRPSGPKPKRDRTLRPVRSTFGSTDSRDPGSGGDPGEEVVGEPVDSTVSRKSGDRGSRTSGSRDDENVFSQVSDGFPSSGSALSTAPTSSGRSEEDLFFCPGAGQALTRHDLARFLSQPPLTQALSQQWEVAVALVARQFAPHATRCAELVEWLADGVDAQPETRLAQIVVDLVRTPAAERVAAVRALETFLRSRGVKFRQSNPDEFIGVYVTTMISALDSNRPIDTWGGWFGGGLKRESHFQGRVLAATMNVLNRLLEQPEGVSVAELNAVADPAGSTSAPGSTTYDKDDPSFVDRLRAAAQGTNWEDDISFEMLLRNHKEQARLLALYARRTGTRE